MTLPTREVMKERIEFLRSGRYAWGDVPEDEVTQAYADDVLQTRAEWLATIDYEAYLKALPQPDVRMLNHLGWRFDGWQEQCVRALDTALGGDDES